MTYIKVGHTIVFQDYMLSVFPRFAQIALRQVALEVGKEEIMYELDKIV
jgi:hypothetical protein